MVRKKRLMKQLLQLREGFWGHVEKVGSRLSARGTGEMRRGGGGPVPGP